MEKGVSSERGQCSSCWFEPTWVTEYSATVYSRTPPEVVTMKLCRVCEATAAGGAAFEPSAYKNAELLRMLAYCTNMVLYRLWRAP